MTTEDEILQRALLNQPLAFHLDWQQAIKTHIFYPTVSTGCAPELNVFPSHLSKEQKVGGNWWLRFGRVCVCIFWHEGPIKKL